jgi:hypothetical protein
MGLAFHSVAILLASYETTRDLWHTAAINGHTNFSKVFLLTPAEGRLLVERGILYYYYSNYLFSFFNK